MTEDALLSVRNLEKHYPVRSGLLRRVTGHVKAVDGVSFDVHEGETLGLVGESGCGKSTTASSLLRLEEPTGGDVYFDGEDVTAYDVAGETEFRRRAQIVFQNPNSAFDPRMTVGESVREPLEIHGFRDSGRGEAITANLLEQVGLSASDADSYPHEFSDGQKQRIALARALVLGPDLLIADEPVSALDVSVQADILSLLADIQANLGLSMLLISHDLGVVRQICDRVAVMYLGKIVEKGPTEAVFEDPQHPYTESLLGSIPDPDPRARGEGVELAGNVPDPSDPPSGCSFHPRCPQIVPPEEFEFATDVFRRILDFRLTVELGDVTSNLSGDAAVREEYGLPSELSDVEAEAALSDAIDAVVVDDVDVAARRLDGEFTTVCERIEPELRVTEKGHVAACHHHESEVAASGSNPGEE